MNATEAESSCERGACREGEVEHWGGCHELGGRGPCPEFEILTLSEQSLEPECSPDQTRVRRILESIPTLRGRVRFGPIGSRLRLRVPRCELNIFGRCRRRKNNLNSRMPLYKSSPQKYLNWLNKYKN